jgi:hypothetical protein
VLLEVVHPAERILGAAISINRGRSALNHINVVLNNFFGYVLGMVYGENLDYVPNENVVS